MEDHLRNKMEKNKIKNEKVQKGIVNYSLAYLYFDYQKHCPLRTLPKQIETFKPYPGRVSDVLAGEL